MNSLDGLTHERWQHGLLTNHEWNKKGFVVGNGQYNNSRYRLHDGDISVVLYERHQVVSTYTGIVREVQQPTDYGETGPSI